MMMIKIKIIEKSLEKVRFINKNVFGHLNDSIEKSLKKSL
jgi:hypothetical protein